MTDIPKTLPWIARKAGIADERIEAIWRDAVRHATLQTGGVGAPAVGTPDYYRAVMQRLFQLVEQEKRAASAQPLSSSAPLRDGPPAEDDADESLAQRRPCRSGTSCRPAGVPAPRRMTGHPTTKYA